MDRVRVLAKRYLSTIRVLALLGAVLLVAARASGGPTPDADLLVMLQYATGIAVVEVVECKPFDPLYAGDLWEPQLSATCEVRDVIAGSPPDRFQVAIYSSNVKTGDRALAFIGRRPNDQVLAKEGHAYLFYMSGGFKLLRELVHSRDDDDNTCALAAIKQAATIVKPPSALFPDEGLVPFCKLLKSQDPDVRWWAFRILRQAANGPQIERTLISCLDTDDENVSCGAADVIVYRRLLLTAELERFLARRQRQALPYVIPRLLKSMLLGPPDRRFSVDHRIRNYLLAVKIQQYLRSLPEANAARLWDGVAHQLSEQQPRLTVGFKIDETGKVRAMSQAVGPDVVALELLEVRLTAFLAGLEEHALSSFDVRFGIAGDSRLIEVFEDR
jgi:hypothetical protein